MKNPYIEKVSSYKFDNNSEEWIIFIQCNFNIYIYVYINLSLT